MNSTLLNGASRDALQISLTSSSLSEIKSLIQVTSESSSSSSRSGDSSISDESDSIYQIGSGLAIFLTIVYLSVSLCAVIGNWMVLWIVMRCQSMRSVTNVFIANLAIADLMIGLLAIPFQFQAALLQKWLLPHFLCSVCPTAQTLSLNLSIFTLVALSVDRHRAVTAPLKPRISRSTGLALLSIIWISAVIISLPTFIAFDITWIGDANNTLEPQCLPSRVPMTFWKTYNHILVTVQYVIPFIIISAAYIHMAIVLSSDAGLRSTDAARVNSSKRRVIKMLFMVISIFAICWLPFQLYNILQDIYPQINEYKYINLIWFSCHLFAMSNSCLNPFIYAVYGEKFNIEFRQRFALCCFWSAQFASTRTISASEGLLTTRTTVMNASPKTNSTTPGQHSLRHEGKEAPQSVPLNHFQYQSNHHHHHHHHHHLHQQVHHRHDNVEASNVKCKNQVNQSTASSSPVKRESESINVNVDNSSVKLNITENNCICDVSET